MPNQYRNDTNTPATAKQMPNIPTIKPSVLSGDVYTDLHRLGFAHSVEAFHEGKLAGGLYGVHIGGVFYGESMFTKVSNASKVAFHSLLEILKREKFILLDTQFINDNVERYGAVEIPRQQFLNTLSRAVEMSCTFR
jgi:leucyl/phenylalanyl-tRNA--protein transferase